MSTETAGRVAPTWIRAAIAGFFALLFAYAVWSGVAYLVTSLQAASGVGMNLVPTALVVLILSIVVPIAAFAVAMLIGFRRGAGRLALVLLVALALTAVFWLDAQAYMNSATVFSV